MGLKLLEFRTGGNKQGTPRYRFLMTVRSLTVLKYTVLFERETDSNFLTVPILAVYGTANYDGLFCTVLKMTVLLKRETVSRFLTVPFARY